MSTNTGGPASEKTLRDEFAGQALPWCLSEFAGNAEDGTQYAEAAYQIADAMLAEKARREAVVQQSSTTPNAGKVAKLQAANRELVVALTRFCEAGYGNSTSYIIQEEAFDLANVALTKAKEVA